MISFSPFISLGIKGFKLFSLLIIFKHEFSLILNTFPQYPSPRIFDSAKTTSFPIFNSVFTLLKSFSKSSNKSQQVHDISKNPNK